jgi:zinc transport system permease protein
VNDLIWLFTESPHLKVVWPVVFVAIAAGCLSPLVVMNRMAFFTDAVAHSSLLGVAAGLFMGLDPDANAQLWPMLLVALAVGTGVWALRKKTGQGIDTLLGVLMVGALAAGVLLYHATNTNRDLHGYLFGSLTLLPSTWFPWIAAASAAIALLAILLFNRMALVAVSPELLRARAVRTAWAEALLVALLAVVVTMGVRTVGVLMVNALLIVPGATARNAASRLSSFFWVSVAAAILAALGGLTVSYEHELPPGPTIVAAAVCLFFLSLAVLWFRKRTRA